MSLIETVTDVNNTFLSRRELICNFAGLGGKLKKLEAINMITSKFNLDGKVVIPMRLKNHVGKSIITGTFYIYDDEVLAKKHVDPTIFTRLERTRAKVAEAAAESAKKEESKAAEAAAESAKKEESKEVKNDQDTKADTAPTKDTTANESKSEVKP